MTLVQFGTHSSLELELDQEVLVEVADAPRGTPLADVASAAREALRAPLGYPPLNEVAMPGDRVVLALGSNVPGLAMLVAAAVDSLVSAGVEPRDIVLLAPAGMNDFGADLLSELSPELQADVNLHQHDPRDRERLSYLAAADDASPIYINRDLHEADLVISIGTLRLGDAPGYHGIRGGLFPTFSDAATQARFRAPKSAQPEQQERLREQADEAGWWLGTRFTIQVVPGANGDVLHVLAGDTDPVLERGAELCDAAWRFQLPARVEVLVAAIGGDERQQTWQNVARAVAAARQVLDAAGDVIICSELAEPLGAGMDRLVGADSLAIALREIEREKPADSLVATFIAQALERGKVYLVSRLNAAEVEDTGIQPIDAEDVSRVAGRYSSCLVLSNAQYAQAQAGRPQPTRAAKRRSRQ